MFFFSFLFYLSRWSGLHYIIHADPMRKPVICLSLASPKNAAGVKKAAQAALIMYTELEAAFMLENDILFATLGGFTVTVQG